MPSQGMRRFNHPRANYYRYTGYADGVKIIDRGLPVVIFDGMPRLLRWSTE
jgi:hypothetical protein